MIFAFTLNVVRARGRLARNVCCEAIIAPNGRHADAYTNRPALTKSYAADHWTIQHTQKHENQVDRIPTQQKRLFTRRPIPTRLHQA